MPQLPSGLHFAFNPGSLNRLIKDATKGILVHKLMAIETADDLFEYIDIFYFRPKSEQYKEWEYTVWSTVPPQDLEAYPSGFNLISIQSEFDKWDKKDQRVFLRFLNSRRTDKYLNGILETIIKDQEAFLKQPSTLPGLLATWWKAGCHPLQDEY